MSAAAVPLGGVRARAATSSRTIILLCYVGYLVSFGDRFIFGLVLKPIKLSLGLTDSQLGLLAGAAFAVVYALCNPFGGFVVDRFNRKAVLVLAVAFWSSMTLLTGFAGTFVTLALARGFVGVGEAFMNPVAVSLIGDAVPRARLARVFSFYLSAGAVGSIGALLLGGGITYLLSGSTGVPIPGLGVVAPWRLVFMAASVPGFVLVLAVLRLLREPARTAPESLPVGAGPDAAREGAREGARAFATRYWGLLVAMYVGLATSQLGAFTWATWNVAFFGRIHGWSITQAALRTGITGGAMALLGCLAAGRIIEALRRRGYADAPLRVGLTGGLVFAALATAGVLAPSPGLAAGLVIAASFCSYLPTIGIYAAMGDVLPPAARGRFAGLNTMATGLITNSVGPLLVGVLSDRVFPSAFGLRYALATTFVATSLVGGALVTTGLAPYRRRMAERLADAALVPA